MQFHVDGADSMKFKRSSLENVRMIAAQLMLVPPEYVTVAGIEPSTSLIITLMVPQRFIKYLETAITKKGPVKDLTNLGIDMIRTDSMTTNLYGMFHSSRHY